MDAKGRGACEPTDGFVLCGLEWVIWAMDAARRHNENDDKGFGLDYTWCHADELTGP